MKKILLSEGDLTAENRPYFNLAVQPSINRHICVKDMGNEQERRYGLYQAVGL